MDPAAPLRPLTPLAVSEPGQKAGGDLRATLEGHLCPELGPRVGRGDLSRVPLWPPSWDALELPKVRAAFCLPHLRLLAHHQNIPRSGGFRNIHFCKLPRMPLGKREPHSMLLFHTVMACLRILQESSCALAWHSGAWKPGLFLPLQSPAVSSTQETALLHSCTGSLSPHEPGKARQTVGPLLWPLGLYVPIPGVDHAPSTWASDRQKLLLRGQCPHQTPSCFTFPLGSVPSALGTRLARSWHREHLLTE